MAKATKTKSRQVSQHSRAARRAASPSIDLDKSITSIKAPTDSVDYNPKIHGAQDAGISKKKKQKPMSRAQRVRKEKGLERAESNIDILEQKTAKSMARARRVDDRRANWEVLNDKTTRGVQPKSTKASKSVDQEDDMSEDEAPARRSVFSASMNDDNEADETKLADAPQQVDVPVNNAANDDDDEIL